MLRLPLEQQFLIVIQAIALVALCARMWRSRLHRTYVWFFDYLLLALIQLVVLVVIPFNGTLYVDAWIATEAIILCFYALIVLETYSTVLRDLPGIATIARRYIMVALVLAFLISALTMVFGKRPTSILAYFFVFERIGVSTLMLLVLLIVAFLVYYPVPLHRNVIVYSIGYAVYFLAKAGSIFINNLGYYWNRLISNTCLEASLVCLLF